MREPWDHLPFPKKGNSERILFEAIGRALMAWEEVEGALAHLYSAFVCGWPFDEEANRNYGTPLNFAQRLRGLEKVACDYFKARPSQDKEGAFDEVRRAANGFAPRRNDIAHGRARLMHWIINPDSPETLLTVKQPVKWCVIPAHFKGDKFTPDNRPAYVLTSPEMKHFSEAFWDLARKVSALIHEIEVPRAFVPPPPP